MLHLSAQVLAIRNTEAIKIRGVLSCLWGLGLPR
ncbi:mCG147322 [Mus musculus]|nr:mCG147322 [Mus musculus]